MSGIYDEDGIDLAYAAVPAAWRQRVEDEIATHRAHGKTPKGEPQNEEEWVALYEKCPTPLFASWFALTGRLLPPS